MRAGGEQLISQDAGLRPEAADYLAGFEGALSPGYFVLGIIGSQSSGKSTLLNALFGTQFGVMDAQSQRRQTTKGIWMQALPERDLLVLDIEGADSRERWQDKQAMERKTALFGLAVCNLLVVNLWLAEIGRFSAANYDIIKLIFEMNLQLFRRDAPKRLLFVVRDFSEEENLAHIAELLRTDARRLWAEVKKPPGCEALDFAEVVSVEVVALRHFVYLRPGFDEDVAALRRRLEPGSPAHLLAGYAFRNVPLDALFLFLRQVWTTVSSNRDLNIPNEKMVVSAFRCNELRAEALAALEPELAAMERAPAADPAFSVKALQRSTAERVLRDYEQRTQHYDQAVAAEGRAQLAKEIAARFAALLRAEDERVAAQLLQQFEGDLQALTAGDFDLKDALTTIAVRRNTAAQAYAEFLEDVDWEAAAKAERSRVFAMQLSKLVAGCVATTSNLVLLGWRKALCARVDALIEQTCRDFTANSWRAFNAQLGELLDAYLRRVGELARSSEEGRLVFGEEALAGQEAELTQWVRDELRKRKGLITHTLIEAFKAEFLCAEDGGRRNWRGMGDAAIEELFARVRRRFAPCLDFLGAAVALAPSNEDVFSKEEAVRMREAVEAAANAMLESAFSEKYNRTALQRVPLWLWVLLVYFMHDNVLVWARSPRFFFLLGFGAVFAAALVSTGLHADAFARVDLLVQRVREAVEEALGSARSAKEGPGAAAGPRYE